jgi:NAD(P)-dependent dehydrogenase (short-subunit alcohol dehydrogenase family)
VTTGESDISNLTDEQYRRLVGANVDGVVFGTRALTPVIAAQGGGSIVVTASLAGLISFPLDPIYTMSKHAVVGFVRSVAPQLQAKGITINAICPGVVDTPLVGDGREMLRQSGFPLIEPEDIAEAVVAAITGGGTGECFAVQKGQRYAWEFGEPQAPVLG